MLRFNHARLLKLAVWWFTVESWRVGSPLPAAPVPPRSPYSVSCCILHSFNNDLENGRSREKSNVLCKNIEDVHSEENINMFFL